jgi:signal peptidase I
VIDEQTERPEGAKRHGGFWKELPILVVVAIAVAVVVRIFVLQTFYIPSESMERTLLINDRVLVNKLVYDFRSPHRGEIVVFEAPASWRTGADKEDFIKRVIGVAGDHIVCCDDRQRLIINDHSLDEPYVYTEDDAATVTTQQQFDIVVPPQRLWMMGDHRSATSDSRAKYIQGRDVVAATIPQDAVVGRAFVIFWPVGRASWLTVPKTFEGVPDPPKR